MSDASPSPLTTSASTPPLPSLAPTGLLSLGRRQQSLGSAPSPAPFDPSPDPTPLSPSYRSRAPRGPPPSTSTALTSPRKPSPSTSSPFRSRPSPSPSPSPSASSPSPLTSSAWTSLQDRDRPYPTPSPQLPPPPPSTTTTDRVERGAELRERPEKETRGERRWNDNSRGVEVGGVGGVGGAPRGSWKRGGEGHEREGTGGYHREGGSRGFDRSASDRSERAGERGGERAPERAGDRGGDRELRRERNDHREREYPARGERSQNGDRFAAAFTRKGGEVGGGARLERDGGRAGNDEGARGRREEREGRDERDRRGAGERPNTDFDRSDWGDRGGGGDRGGSSRFSRAKDASADDDDPQPFSNIRQTSGPPLSLSSSSSAPPPEMQLDVEEVVRLDQLYESHARGPRTYDRATLLSLYSSSPLPPSLPPDLPMVSEESLPPVLLSPPSEAEEAARSAPSGWYLTSRVFAKRGLKEGGGGGGGGPIRRSVQTGGGAGGDRGGTPAWFDAPVTSILDGQTALDFNGSRVERERTALRLEREKEALARRDEEQLRAQSNGASRHHPLQARTEEASLQSPARPTFDAPHLSALVPNSPLAPSSSSSSAAPPPTSTPLWYYKDPQRETQGPFTGAEMRDWYLKGFFDLNLPVLCSSTPLDELRAEEDGHPAAALFVPLGVWFAQGKKAFMDSVPDVGAAAWVGSGVGGGLTTGRLPARPPVDEGDEEEHLAHLTRTVASSLRVVDDEDDHAGGGRGMALPPHARQHSAGPMWGLPPQSPHTVGGMMGPMGWSSPAFTHPPTAALHSPRTPAPPPPTSVLMQSPSNQAMHGRQVSAGSEGVHATPTKPHFPAQPWGDAAVSPHAGDGAASASPFHPSLSPQQQRAMVEHQLMQQRQQQAAALARERLLSQSTTQMEGPPASVWNQSSASSVLRQQPRPMSAAAAPHSYPSTSAPPPANDGRSLLSSRPVEADLFRQQRQLEHAQQVQQLQREQQQQQQQQQAAQEAAEREEMERRHHEEQQRQRAQREEEELRQRESEKEEHQRRQLWVSQQALLREQEAREAREAELRAQQQREEQRKVEQQRRAQQAAAAGAAAQAPTPLVPAPAAAALRGVSAQTTPTPLSIPTSSAPPPPLTTTSGTTAPTRWAAANAVTSSSPTSAAKVLSLAEIQAIEAEEHEARVKEERQRQRDYDEEQRRREQLEAAAGVGPWKTAAAGTAKGQKAGQQRQGWSLADIMAEEEEQTQQRAQATQSSSTVKGGGAGGVWGAPASAASPTTASSPASPSLAGHPPSAPTGSVTREQRMLYQAQVKAHAEKERALQEEAAARARADADARKKAEALERSRAAAAKVWGTQVQTIDLRSIQQQEAEASRQAELKKAQRLREQQMAAAQSTVLGSVWGGINPLTQQVPPAVLSSPAAASAAARAPPANAGLSLREIQSMEAAAAAAAALSPVKTAAGIVPSSSGGVWNNIAKAPSADTSKKASTASPNNAGSTRSATSSTPPAANGDDEEDGIWDAPQPSRKQQQQPGRAAASPAPSTSSSASLQSSAFGVEVSLSPEFSAWCRTELHQLTGSDDLTLVQYLLTLDDEATIEDTVVAYLGGDDSVHRFAQQFIRNKQFDQAGQGAKIGGGAGAAASASSQSTNGGSGVGGSDGAKKGRRKRGGAGTK